MPRCAHHPCRPWAKSWRRGLLESRCLWTHPSDELSRRSAGLASPTRALAQLSSIQMLQVDALLRPVQARSCLLPGKDLAGARPPAAPVWPPTGHSSPLAPGCHAHKYPGTLVEVSRCPLKLPRLLQCSEFVPSSCWPLHSCPLLTSDQGEAALPHLGAGPGSLVDGSWST